MASVVVPASDDFWMLRGPAKSSGADAAAQMSAGFSSADAAVETMLLGPSGVMSYRVSVRRETANRSRYSTR